MNKFLLFSMGVLFLFASCKKNETLNSNPANEKLYEVKFNVSTFSQTVSDFPGGGNGKISATKVMNTTVGGTTGKLTDYINNLEYYLYNNQGTRIANRIIQPQLATGNLELPTASLKAGKYQVVFVGSHTKNGHNSLYHGDNQDYTRLYNNLYSEFTDIFFNTVEFEIGSEDAVVDVKLSRPGGKIKIVIEDEWPANVSRIGLSINGATNISLKDDYLGQSERNDISIQKNYLYSYEIINGNQVPKYTYIDCSWENFIFTNSTNVVTLKGTITAYSQHNDVITSKNITGIRVEKNKVTTATGKLFDDMGRTNTSSFKISLDADLSGSIHHPF